MVTSLNILEFLYFAARFILSSNSNYCLLYFNANIMCSFTKKRLDPAGGLPSPRSLVFFYIRPIILRLTPLDNTLYRHVSTQ